MKVSGVVLNSALSLAVLSLSLTASGCSNAEIKTHTRFATNSRVTVVHLFSSTCPACKEMTSDWQTFESKYGKIAKMIAINTADKDSDEYKANKALIDKCGGAVPTTYWLDNDGKILHEQAGSIDGKILGRNTLLLDMKMKKKQQKA